jgi:anionic cell wall polymer biosynthesis LytR-Cps2A-Psr (LCP) family protein
MDKVGDIVGKEITQYVLIDFDGFRRLIDAVGGIDIDVPTRLYDAAYPTRNWGYTVVDIPTGLQHFDGDKALKYARSRHSTSDFDRSKRQQLVLGALQEKMLSAKILTSPRKIEGIYSVLSDSIKTNASVTDMIKMAKKAAKFEKKNLHGYILDGACVEVLKFCHPGGLTYSPSRDLFG